MKKIILASTFFVFSSVLAFAQQKPDPTTQALGQMVAESQQREFAAKVQLADLQAQLAAANAKIATLEKKDTTPEVKK